MPFPKNFLWGVSTSATQIEGAYDEDGKCLSIWDCLPKGKVKNNEDAKKACDHYHLYKNDVALLKELGVKCYRFSINMSRIMPFYEQVNNRGLEFYSKLVDELLANGIEPMVTIYHWDLPFWLEEMGGWKNKKIVKYFEIYTKAVVEKLSDRVKYWISFNEPACFLFNGYVQGAHAPFIKNPLLISKISRNFFYANAAVIRTIRNYAKQKPIIGLSFNCAAKVPVNESKEEIEKARKITFESKGGILANTWFLDPILAKKPVKAYGIYKVSQKTCDDCYENLDFIGINNYSPFSDYTSKEKPIYEWSNMLGWENNGKGLYWTIRFIHERYSKDKPIMVTENGLCLKDQLEDEKVHDLERIRYLKEYLLNLERAIDEKIPVFGYSYWSFMDNFEWAEGYEPRFGLVYVDYENEKRIFKDSAYYYKDLINSNGAILKDEGYGTK